MKLSSGDRVMCTTVGCHRRVKARHLCDMHYRRQRASGELSKISADDRFWAQVVKSDSCWTWVGWVNNVGYGRFSIKNRLVFVHRWAHERYVAPIPESWTIDHLCRNKLCVRPDHLEAVSLAENVRRGVAVRPRRLPGRECAKGHAKTGVRPDGGFYCRECARDRQRRYAARKRHEARLRRLSARAPERPGGASGVATHAGGAVEPPQEQPEAFSGQGSATLGTTPAHQLLNPAQETA